MRRREFVAQLGVLAAAALFRYRPRPESDADYIERMWNAHRPIESRVYHIDRTVHIYPDDFGHVRIDGRGSLLRAVKPLDVVVHVHDPVSLIEGGDFAIEMPYLRGLALAA